jgi:1-acyl-sn-glycerol-3-phosphate acyltransferase
MQAGVPIVPIVIQNSSDSMPKNSAIIRPASISVKVLPPIPTDDWSTETIHEQADRIRFMFLKELGQVRGANTRLRRVK